MEEYINKIISELNKNNCFSGQYNTIESYDSNLGLCESHKFITESEKNNERNEEISYRSKSFDKTVEEKKRIFSIIKEKHHKHHDYIKTKKEYIENGIKARYQKCNNKYTYDDFKNTVLGYIDYVIKKNNGSKKRENKTGNIGPQLILTSILREIRASKFVNNTALIDKSCMYVSFIFSKYKDSNMALYKYFISDAGIKIISLVFTTICRLGIGNYKSGSPANMKHTNELVKFYMSEFEDMIIYYARLCLDPNGDLKVVNSDLIRNTFLKLEFFCGLEKSKIVRGYKSIIFDLGKKNKRYSEFKELHNGFVKKFPKLKEALKCDKAVTADLFYKTQLRNPIGKKRNRSEFVSK